MVGGVRHLDKSQPFGVRPSANFVFELVTETGAGGREGGRGERAGERKKNTHKTYIFRERESQEHRRAGRLQLVIDRQ